MARSRMCHRTTHQCCYGLGMAMLLFTIYPTNLVIGARYISTVYFIIIIIIGSTAVSGSWRPQADTSDLYPAQPTVNFYNAVSLYLPLPRQSILISVGHVIDDLQGLSIISF